MAYQYSNPNFVSGLDYDDSNVLFGAVANTSDLLQGIEQAQAYFTNQDVADLSVCCECECNCDIFSDRLVSRTGASDPSNIEFDRTDKRVWTKTGSVTLGSKTIYFLPNVPPFLPADHACAIFTGDSSLKCMTPPLDSRNFCVGFMFRFENSTVGQTVKIKYGGITGTFTIVSSDTSRNLDNTYNIISYADIYAGSAYGGFIEGTLTGSEMKIRVAYCGDGSFYSGVLSVKDGRASLLLGYGETLGGPSGIAPVKYDLFVPGITQTTTGSTASDFVTLETSSLSGEFQLFGFHLSNIENTSHHPKCQGHIYGTERVCSDNYPAGRYQLDFNLKLIGTTSAFTSDFQVIETLTFTMIVDTGIVSPQPPVFIANGHTQLASWTSRGTPDSPLRAAVSRTPPNTPFYEFTSCYAYLAFIADGPNFGGQQWPLIPGQYTHSLSLTNFFTPGYAESGSPGYTFYGNWVINFVDEGPVTDPVRSYSARRYKMNSAVGTGYSSGAGFFSFNPFPPLGDFTVHQHSSMYVRGVGTYAGGPYSYVDVTAL